jgi:RNA-binding protein YlmH
MKYYHITHEKNLNAILEDGLKCNESGEIFVFEDKSIIYSNVVNTVADIIARNQTGLNEYIMFEKD